MDNDYGKDLRAACGCDRYPQGFLEEYEPFECLASNEAGETLLVKNKRTGMFYVAKCYQNGNVVSHATEAEILKILQHTGLPRFVDEYQSADMLCVVREYVEGTPLDRWAAQRKPDTAAAVRIAMSLCNLVQYLHGQTPPIIHRDIKPQNLIVGTDGQLWLIDFGISRLYREESEKDTACWGTQDFAAPEQYGFAQTDVRSDIYSFGVVLGWLLTGEAGRDAALPKIADRRLKKIVTRCTAFAPKERYASAAKVCADLAALDGHRRRQTLRRLCAAALCAVCLCAGFALGRYTDIFTPADTGVSFAEPLIGQAVRLMLGKADGAAVTEDELLSIRELYIFGSQPAINSTDYQALQQQPTTGAAINGGIADLSDLARMPNLSVVCLMQQNITDLSPLAGLAALREVDLRHNPLTDAAPLAQCTQLRSVCLFDTRVSDLSPFAACKQLTELDVGGTFITSVASLKGNESITRLRLFKAPLQTLAGVEALPQLLEIELSQVADGDLTPLLALPKLQTATLGEALRDLANSTLGDAAFAITYREN
ncbi:MAG TPA: protein kinase [Candidatus Limiplasma sp.]|nr:protein kinase [Candidatus Limiplasma sp.]